MEKTILIAGKNMPDAGSFTDGVAFSGRNIIITGPQTDEVQPVKKLTIAERKANQAAYEEEKNLEAKSGICTIEWNKSSPLSARSLVLQTLTIFNRMDEAVLYFDEEWFASKAEKMDSEEIARGCDECRLSVSCAGNNFNFSKKRSFGRSWNTCLPFKRNAFKNRRASFSGFKERT